MPGVAGLDRRAEVHGLAVHQHLPCVGLHGAGEHLDQRRLAGAVVADHAEDLVRPQVEIGVIERDDAAVALDQAARFEDGPAVSGSCRVTVTRPSGSIGRA